MIRLFPSTLQGRVKIPSSKSQTQRAIFFASLARGKSTILNYLNSSDTAAMIEAMQSFGAKIEIKKDRLEIVGFDLKPKSPDTVIDAKNSGLVFRFSTALAALLPTYTIITGDSSIRYNRIIEPLCSALCQMGASAFRANFKTGSPIIVKGPISAKNASLSGEDSQPISALCSICALLNGISRINVKNPQETPWIDLTLHWLKKFSVAIECKNYRKYIISGPTAFSSFEYSVPGDLSQAAFFAISSLISQTPLTLENITLDDPQGDRHFFLWLEKQKVTFEKKANSVTLIPQAPFSSSEIDMSKMIDMIPILAVLACFGKTKCTLINAKIARKKESDRLSAITTELRKMKAKIEERNGSLIIFPSKLKGAKLFSHSDHRIAMALSIASLHAEGESELIGSECTRKSFPLFFSSLKKLKAKIE